MNVLWTLAIWEATKTAGSESYEELAQLSANSWDGFAYGFCETGRWHDFVWMVCPFAEDSRRSHIDRYFEITVRISFLGENQYEQTPNLCDRNEVGGKGVENTLIEK